MTKLFKKINVLDDAFRTALVLKGLDGLLETIGGVLLLFIRPAQIDHLAQVLTQRELSEDPHDLVATHLVKVAHHFDHSSFLFGAIYLLSHGVVKLVLVALVFADLLWAYILLIGVTGLFIVYQIYSMTQKFTLGMFLLTVFDAIVIYLTCREYGKHKARLESGHKKLA
jgi:uncharacterized membrane protein